MKMYHYPDLNKHISEHQEATHKSHMFMVEYERGGQNIDIELLKFLSDFIQNHVLRTDRNYIPYIQGKV
jgi:hemerythrin